MDVAHLPQALHIWTIYRALAKGKFTQGTLTCAVIASREVHFLYIHTSAIIGVHSFKTLDPRF